MLPRCKNLLQIAGRDKGVRPTDRTASKAIVVLLPGTNNVIFSQLSRGNFSATYEIWHCTVDVYFLWVNEGIKMFTPGDAAWLDHNSTEATSVFFLMAVSCRCSVLLLVLQQCGDADLWECRKHESMGHLSRSRRNVSHRHWIRYSNYHSYYTAVLTYYSVVDVRRWFLSNYRERPGEYGWPKTIAIKWLTDFGGHISLTINLIT